MYIYMLMWAHVLYQHPHTLMHVPTHTHMSTHKHHTRSCTHALTG